MPEAELRVARGRWEDFKARMDAERRRPRATPGACVFVPPQVPHAFANRIETAARFLLVMSPAGHDRYFDELAEILAADGPPDSAAIADLRRRYNTTQLSSLVA
ncbi:MAG: cupin domain-containing protein [Gaiellaceae bacterium]